MWDEIYAGQKKEQEKLILYEDFLNLVSSPVNNAVLHFMQLPPLMLLTSVTHYTSE